jgi:hypothetical protein
MPILLKLWGQQWFRYLAVALIGVTVGALFYPTKRIEERVSQKYQAEMTSLKEVHAKEISETKDNYDKQLQVSNKKIQESELKVTKLSSEVRNLQSKQKTAFFKIVRADGTVEIQKFSESEVNESTKVVTQIQTEFKQKIEQIEQKWETIHKDRVTKLQKDFESKEEAYKKEISEFKSSKVTEVNKKNFGIEGGMTTDKNYYGHATADIWGPVFLGLHGTMGNNKELGAGLGLRF